jgi:hypothetical protein
MLSCHYYERNFLFIREKGAINITMRGVRGESFGRRLPGKYSFTTTKDRRQNAWTDVVCGLLVDEFTQDEYPSP